MSDAKILEKPVLFPDDRADAERFDPQMHRGHLDPSRIPGYSEIVQANDIARADDQPKMVYYLDALMIISSLQHELDFQVAEYGVNVASEDIKMLRELLSKFEDI